MRDENPTPAVMDLIRTRVGSGERDDGYKLGLALEGGGVRGVVSGAMLIAMRAVGADRAFDTYCGTSSGSINLSYFLTGASWDALAVYYDFLVGDEFVHLTRAVTKGPILDLNFLFDQVMKHDVPLDYAQVADLPKGLLNVGVTNVDEIRSYVRDSFDSPTDVYHSLKAGAWLPILAGGTYERDGARFLDSGVLYPDPLFAALDAGCTHVLVCNTRPQSKKKTNHSSTQRKLVRRVLNNYQRGLGDAYFERHAAWDLARVDLGYGETRYEGARIYRLAAAQDAHVVGRLTKDKGLLLAGARAGYASVLDAFGLPTDHLRFAIKAVLPPSVDELSRLRHGDSNY